MAARGAGAAVGGTTRSEAKEGLMEKSFAKRFAMEWVAAWNSHDLERILAHYEDDFEMSSPIITIWLENVPKSFGAKWQSAHIGPGRFDPYQTSDSNCSRRWPA